MKTPLVRVGDCAKIVNGFAFKSALFTTERTGLPVTSASAMSCADVLKRITQVNTPTAP